MKSNLLRKKKQYWVKRKIVSYCTELEEEQLNVFICVAAFIATSMSIGFFDEYCIPFKMRAQMNSGSAPKATLSYQRSRICRHQWTSLAVAHSWWLLVAVYSLRVSCNSFSCYYFSLKISFWELRWVCWWPAVALFSCPGSISADPGQYVDGSLTSAV